MDISLLAGRPAPKEMLVDLSRLEKEYFERRPDLKDPTQRVSFGTSAIADLPSTARSPRHLVARISR
jgi:hypothetical protein